MAFTTAPRPFENYAYVPRTPAVPVAAPVGPARTTPVVTGSQAAAAVGQRIPGPTPVLNIPATYAAGAPVGAAPPRAAAAPPVQAPGAAAGGMFGSDPGVAQAGAAENLGLANLRTSLDEARRQAIIRWGDPALAGLAGFGVDPQAGTFAKQNYLSGNADLARLDEARKQRRLAVVNRLASHGIVDSGDLGYLEGQNDVQYGQERYDAQNKYLDYFRQLIEQYLTGSQDLRQKELDSYYSAFNKYAQNPGVYYSGA